MDRALSSTITQSDRRRRRTLTIQIRPERTADIAAIGALNRAAFKTSAEANLVDALRETADPIVSLVAEAAGSIVDTSSFHR